MKKLMVLIIFLILMVSVSVLAQTQTSIRVDIRDTKGVLILQNYLYGFILTKGADGNLYMTLTLRDSVPVKPDIIFKIDGVVQPLSSATIEIKR
jgi:hypothetical protein